MDNYFANPLDSTIRDSCVSIPDYEMPFRIVKCHPNIFAVVAGRYPGYWRHLHASEAELTHFRRHSLSCAVIYSNPEATPALQPELTGFTTAKIKAYLADRLPSEDLPVYPVSRARSAGTWSNAVLR